MKNSKYLLSFLIIGFLAFTSCKTQKQVVSTPKQAKLENALLWKVEGKGLTEASYVFGTIHLISNEDYFLPKGFLTAFDQSDKIFFEIDINDMSDMSKMMGLMDKLLMKDDLSLSDLLSEVDYKVVENHFKKIGIPLMMFERMKPMFLQIFALTDMNPDDLKTGVMKSYEMELNELAIESEKPTAGLESIEFQLSIFDTIPYKFQAEGLVKAIKQGEDGDDSLAKLVKIYKDMDIEAMVKTIEEDPDSEMGGFEDILLKKRNQKWIPIMAEAMTKESNLFAVGAGHLAGEYGVLNLLKEQGYKVSPVFK